MNRIGWVSTLAAVLLAAGCETGAVNSAGTNSSSSLTGVPKPNVEQMMKLADAATKEAKQHSLKELEATVKAHPKDETALIAAGIGAYDAGQFKLAIQYYQQALKVDPSNAIAYNNLGNVYLRGLHDVASARDNYEHAVALDPQYGYAWWNLAECDLQAGDKSAAKRDLEQGIAHVKPTDPAYAGMKKMLKSL